MRREKNVAEINAEQYVEFLNKIHGKSRLDKFEIVKGSYKTPCVHIVRSSLKADYEMRRVYNEYVFADSQNNTRLYDVRWVDEDGEMHDISKRFEDFVDSNITKELIWNLKKRMQRHMLFLLVKHATE